MLPHGGYVGVLGTSRTGFDRGPEPPWELCPNGEAPTRGACFADAYTFGPDLRVRSKDGVWVGTGQAVGTLRWGGTPTRFPEGDLDRGEPRWLETDAERGVYQLARLYAHALGFVTRLNYTITPKLELQLHAQLLGVGTVFDGGYMAPIGVERVRLDALMPDATFTRQGETEALLVANLFLRWEYAPGSNLYLVATRNQLDPFDPRGEGGLDYRSVGQTAAGYTFLVKATALLGW